MFDTKDTKIMFNQKDYSRGVISHLLNKNRDKVKDYIAGIHMDSKEKPNDYRTSMKELLSVITFFNPN